MGKRKEIKFRRDGRVYEGRQNGVIFRLYEDRDKIKTCAPAYSVTAVDTKNEGREICTAGHQYFHMDAAKEFCQQIAAGEIDLETLQEKFAAETPPESKRQSGPMPSGPRSSAPAWRRRAFRIWNCWNWRPCGPTWGAWPTIS